MTACIDQLITAATEGKTHRCIAVKMPSLSSQAAKHKHNYKYPGRAGDVVIGLLRTASLSMRSTKPKPFNFLLPHYTLQTTCMYVCMYVYIDSRTLTAECEVSTRTSLMSRVPGLDTYTVPYDGMLT